jgi:predicted lipid carrier protein YhbT
MNYSPEELEKMYHQYAPVIAESVNRASEKKQEQEKKQQEKRKAKRGW